VNYPIELLTIGNQSRSILEIFSFPTPTLTPRWSRAWERSSVGWSHDWEILDRMEARLLVINVVAEDKQRAESVSLTMESTADKHFTEFDNEVVLGYLAVTRTDTGLAAFDHENGDINLRVIPIMHTVSRCVAVHPGPIDDDECFSLRQLQASPPANLTPSPQGSPPTPPRAHRWCCFKPP
jgi:hypothetical protein